MVYKIIFKPSAEKSFSKLPKKLQSKIIEDITLLGINPRPIGVKKLKSVANFYRIRINDYRVIYSIEDDILIITVIKIAHRSDIYNNLAL